MYILRVWGGEADPHIRCSSGYQLEQSWEVIDLSIGRFVAV